MLYKLILFFSVAFCVGCSLKPEDHPALEAEVNRFIRVGMPVSEARQGMLEQGFSCSYGSAYYDLNAEAQAKGEGVVECVRSKDGFLLYSCSHWVHFFYSYKDSVVKSIRVPKPGCTGL